MAYYSSNTPGGKQMEEVRIPLKNQVHKCEQALKELDTAWEKYTGAFITVE